MALPKDKRYLLLSEIRNLLTNELFSYSVSNRISLEGVHLDCFDLSQAKTVAMSKNTYLIMENFTISDMSITLISTLITKKQYNERFKND